MDVRVCAHMHIHAHAVQCALQCVRHSGVTGSRSLSADAAVAFSHKFTWVR